MMNKDLIAVMEEKMHDFSKGQRAIATYIIGNYEKAHSLLVEVKDIIFHKILYSLPDKNTFTTIVNS